MRSSDAPAAGDDVDTASDGEYLRVVVGAESAGPFLDETVHDLHAGIAGRRQQPFDVGHRLAACLLSQYRQPGIGADDCTLAFLRDDRGVRRGSDIDEVDFHTGAGTSPGGVTGIS